MSEIVDVHLEILEDSDAPGLLDLINRNRAELKKFWWEEKMMSRAACQEFIYSANLTEQRTSLPTRGIWTDRLIGVISLHSLQVEHRRAAVGYWLDKEQYGHGYMPRAVRLLAAQAFESTTLESLVVAMRADNQASRHVVEKAGFCLTGIDRQPTWQSANGELETAHYELRRADLVEAS